MKLGLKSTRQQRHTLDTIGPHIKEVRKTYRQAGVKRMKDWLRELKGVNASDRNLIASYNRLHFPEEVRQRKAKRLKRKQFWSPGVFAVVAVDQHDKWGRYGLYLHLGMEAFSGALLWLKIWWTNSNPRLIFSFYLEMARRYGGIPLLTQSDPGNENNGIANGHSMLRQRLDPSLQGKLQHRWMRGHSNIKPEMRWSQIRREFTSGYEDLFREGVVNNWYDKHNLLEKFIFQWLAIPFMQLELNKYVQMYNNSKPRADKNKILPIGIPRDIMEHPERYKGGRDYKES
ncbi:hypothetical protein CALCODRAFT_536231 [Calocera cornea HHB12733]|uniref:Integrase core domain-containing protein n=1 Tax=Calocera cornea HHB12733 TaxID=1353952 RepID=A0A165HSQ3_9BASI|nr:hypothetical protein CALCODRAFT_536231 [Calocera cornea HHB12733]